MPLPIINSIASWILKKRIHQIELFTKYPIEVQEEILFGLLRSAENTVLGKKYDYNSIKNYDTFNERIPVSTYEELEPFIEQTRQGAQNIFWNSNIKYFAKSSGTTNAKSKFIPISTESLEDCHYAAGKTMFALYLNAFPETNIFMHKNLRIGGSSELYQKYDTLFGDLSAILIDNLPFYAEMKNIPNREISLMSDWKLKMNAIINATKNEDVGSLTGVPSWMMVVLNKLMAETGKNYLDEIWPNLEVFFHGGISFKPYAENYNQITHKNLNYFELYNASEGFFGIQDQLNNKDLLLLLDNGIFYEFIPMEDFGTENQRYLTIGEVEIGKNYAMVITTNGGLWRYIIGDTVRFTSTNPHRIVVSGRTKHYINAFGEELMIENAEEALKRTCDQTNSIISEYTAGPVFMQGREKGSHEWMIEFEKEPENFEEFIDYLDKNLQDVNSDYEAKRYNNMTLNRPIVHKARKKLFIEWMASRGKLGGQNKVPRLSNERNYLESLLSLQ